MKRYITMRTKAADMWDGPDPEDYLSRTVFEREPQAIKTGLLDAHGNDIYMIEENDPIGFVRWEDQANG